MRRQWVFALVLVTALVSVFAGYYARALRDDDSSAADCEAAINYFEIIQDFPDSAFRDEKITDAGDNMQNACLN